MRCKRQADDVPPLNLLQVVMTLCMVYASETYGRARARIGAPVFGLLSEHYKFFSMRRFPVPLMELTRLNQMVLASMNISVTPAFKKQLREISKFEEEAALWGQFWEQLSHHCWKYTKIRQAVRDAVHAPVTSGQVATVGLVMT